MNEPALMNATELMRFLKISRTKFYNPTHEALLKSLEVKRPLGTRKYSRRLAEAYVNGESLVRLGKGRRGA